MRVIELVCADCAKLAKCKSAPDSADALLNHTCDRWEPLHSAIVSARQNIYNRFGAASRDGFRKKEKAMKPEGIIQAANTGDIEALEALRTQEINPVNLMLAAANVDKGAGGAIAEAYRKLAGDDEARRNMLIDRLIDKAKSVAQAAAEAPAEEEAPAPKKRRSRRKKAEPETKPEPTDEEKEAAKAEFIKEQAAPATATAQVVDRTDEVLAAIANLAKRLEAVESQLTDVHAQGRLVEKTGETVQVLSRNLGRVRNAFQDFEVELIASGTVGDTPFLKATEDWE